MCLRPRQFDLLVALLQAPGKVVSREELYLRLWGDEGDGRGKTLNMHVHGLRHRLREHGEDPASLVAIRGRGFRYDPPGLRPG
jgi:DNA-binding response OmpR family regulator